MDKNFDWGGIKQSEIDQHTLEFNNKIYERIFEVEKDDIVVDIGAMIGTFTYSILHKEPEHCFVVEPNITNFRTLYQNLKGKQVSFTLGGISNKNTFEAKWYDSNMAKGMTFGDFIMNNQLYNVDFLKCDCEGGEYLIFTEDYVDYLKNGVKKIACEFHLNKDNFDTGRPNRDHFREFRDNILQEFKNYEVYSTNGVDIKWDLWNEHFIEYYNEVIIYIDNR